MRWDERLLSALARPPAEVARGDAQEEYAVEPPLAKLERVFPDFRARIRDRRILDFGCGRGHQSVSLAQAGAAHVLGLDTNPPMIAHGRSLAERAGVSDCVEFATHVAIEQAGTFDLVISQNAMEHYPDPKAILEEMIRALHPDGLILLTFGPPWFAPWGSHMGYFLKVPWVNLLFPEATVMRLRSRYRSDDAQRYEEVEGGLNRMTVRKFERLVSETGLDVLFQHYECVTGLNWLGRLPILRELFINDITCILRRLPNGPSAGGSGR